MWGHLPIRASFPRLFLRQEGRTGPGGPQGPGSGQQWPDLLPASHRPLPRALAGAGRCTPSGRDTSLPRTWSRTGRPWGRGAAARKASAAACPGRTQQRPSRLRPPTAPALRPTPPPPRPLRLALPLALWVESLCPCELRQSLPETAAPGGTLGQERGEPLIQ